MPERGRARDRTGGYAGTWPPRESCCRESLSIRRPTFWSAFAAKLRTWARAEAGAGRLLPWVPVAFGAGIAVYFTADREPVAWVATATAAAFCLAALLLRRHRLLSACGSRRGDDRRVRHGDVEDRARCPRRACSSRCTRLRSKALSKPTKCVNAPTGLFCALSRWRPRATHQTGSGAALGQKGHRTRRRQLCGVESATAAAARTDAARKLRFRTRHVFPGHRRVGLCHGCDQGRGPAASAAAWLALCRADAGASRCHRCAHTPVLEWRFPRDCDGTSDRAARCHHRRLSTTPCSFPGSAMCSRFPAITWPSSPASCSLRSARCWR